MTTNEKVMKYLQKKYPLEKNTSDKPTTVIVLDGQLINHMTDDVKKYLENFKNLEEIALAFCNLNSLQNFPDLPKLSKIELSDNHIKGEDLSNLTKYKNLSKLRIANNNIKNIDEIKSLESLSELTYIDLTDSPVTNKENYREKLFNIFKKLKYLDGVDKDGKVCEEEEDDNEEEEEELELDEDDNKFIDDEKREGAENEDELEEAEDDLEDNEEERDEEDEKEEDNKKKQNNKREEIENPNPSKKRKVD